MRPGPVTRAATGGLTRRRVQTIVIGLVLLVSTGASVLALALVVDSSSPFDRAFAAQRGAHVVATVDPARATGAELAATRRLAEGDRGGGAVRQATVTVKAPGPHAGHSRGDPAADDAGRTGLAGWPGR